MAYYIGIDLGTSSVKLVLMEERGSILREFSQDYRLLQPAQGWKEIDPQTWWDATAKAMDQLLVDVDGSLIEGIGITGQMHTVVMLDAQGNSIRPALMWNDSRTKDMIPLLKEQIWNTGVSYINQFISTGSPAANLLWFRQNEPENFAKMEHFLIGPDYLVYRFTGTYGTDYCEASTSSLYDILHRRWSSEMRGIVGLPETVYPTVRGSAEIAGTVLPEIAARFGLDSNTKVLVGTGDNPAASIPTGCLGSQYPVFSLGTSGVLMFPRTVPDFAAKGKNILFSFDSQTFYTLVQGVIQSCGSGYSWWNSIVLQQEISTADQDIDINRLGENELIFYPHLVGDKNLYADPTLRGAFLGLSTDTTRADMTQAVMEGIAFGLRQLTEAMHLSRDDISNLKVIGGGSRSRVWMQILADVLGVPMEQMEGNVGAGYGMALLAAYRCGAFSSLDEIAAKTVSVKARFMPRLRNTALYAEKYKRYLRVHDALKSVFK